MDDVRAASNDAPHLELMQSEIQQCIEVFNGHVVKTIDRINFVQPQVLSVAFPWWSIRRWTRKPSEELDLSAVAEKARDAQLKRKELAQEIAARARNTSPRAS